ncbi:MAG: NAD(P)/FAD-dependent oxidoreductase [Anaerolineales bacterium]
MTQNAQTHWDVIIIGGGAAGFFAAIRCAGVNPKLRVLILEKSSQTLGKVLISGGGRCNVTHACFEPEQLAQFYPRGGSELRGAFERFQPQDTAHWFERHGVKLKIEADGRMFPTSDSSETVAACLRGAAEALGARVFLRANVLGVEKSPQGGFRLTGRMAAQDFRLRAKRIIFATGGDAPSRKLIQTLGHSIVEPVPSLFTFNIQDQRIAGLAGVAVKRVTLKMENIAAQGALLITHWGMSGPAVLKCSAWGARVLFEKKYRARLQVNWLDELTQEKALEALTRNKEWKDNARKKVLASPAFSQISIRLWKQLLAWLGDKNWADVSKADLRRMAQELTAGEFEISGKGQFKDEFVICGGVNLKEVNFKTMQSRLTEGVFFAGEALDIDGLTGGFNLQAAWTTGWLAGGAAAEIF